MIKTVEMNYEQSKLFGGTDTIQKTSWKGTKNVRQQHVGEFSELYGSINKNTLLLVLQ